MHSLLATARLQIVALILAATCLGCASTGEPGFEIPHGTPITHDQIPEVLRVKLNLPVDASVERFGEDPNTASYRIQYKDGTITTIGPDGSLLQALI